MLAQMYGMDATVGTGAARKDWSKPILRWTRDGWRWAVDLRYIGNAGAILGSVGYVGPYPSAEAAYRECVGLR